VSRGYRNLVDHELETPSTGVAGRESSVILSAAKDPYESCGEILRYVQNDNS
jgi:hypothetical protein